MSLQVIINQMLIIFLLMLLGAVLNKRKIITVEGSRELSNLIMTVLNPAIIISGSLSKERAGSMQDVVISAGLAFAMYAFFVLLGFIIPRLCRCERKDDAVYNLMTIFSNIGFIGIPVVAAVFGKGAVIFVTMYNLPYNLLIYTYGVYLMTKDKNTKNGEKGRQNGFQIRSFFSPGTIASIAGIVIFAAGIQLPEVFSSSIDYLANATTALSMLVIGVSLAQMSVRDIFRNGRLYVFCVIRMILVPILAIWILRPLISNPVVYQVAVILIAMPVGSLPVIMATKYDADVTLASRGVILSTCLSVFTVPLVSLFF